ncbi:ParB/RepB/Spo0J family partition protein [Deinococcus detaillensis]|uniref:ParB/RepB/Spo0J family partition protein n=1 Tax=Deinococcus detaillensis TaxID=2592048 RepID=A0A553V4T0_9DEIO|nr:ParB/RepB/Spo0J family partition protein [Deinococcus detaillensis]TSA87477.1 ParB/RepB/Spo0J family partition protein [Deinococcus detaillensis]
MTKNRFQRGNQASSLGNLLNRSLQMSGVGTPDSADQQRPPDARVLPLSALVANPRQPRRFFDSASLQQLSESLKERGVLQPLMVRPLEGHNGQYEIVYGERRWRAAQLAQLSEVPVLIRDLTPQEAEIISAVENLQREDLNRYDEVMYKLRLVAQLFEIAPEEASSVLKGLRANPDSSSEKVTQLDELFTQLGREQWRSFVTNGLPVLRLPPSIAEALQSGVLEYSKAVLLSRAPEQHHKALLKRVITKNLTHAELKEAIAKLKPAAPQPAVSPLSQVKRHLSVQRLSQLPEQQRQRAEALLSELADLLEG